MINAEIIDSSIISEAIAAATSGEFVDRQLFVIAFRDARRQCGLSREQLAAQTGLALAHLTRIELGDHAIAPEEVPVLAQVLQVPPVLLARLCPAPLAIQPLSLPSLANLAEPIPA